MTHAVLLAGFVMCIYGSFLVIRGLIRLYKSREMKMFWSVLLMFVIPPVLIVIAGYYIFFGDISKFPDAWVIAPVIMLIIFWMCIGYFLETYMKKEMRRKLDGQAKFIPVRPKNCIRNNLLTVGACVIVWIYGMCGGPFFNSSFETVVMCVCMFFFGQGCVRLWKYRGF